MSYNFKFSHNDSISTTSSNYEIILSNSIVLQSLSSSIRQSFGPYGLSKVLIENSDGEHQSNRIIISSEGYIILKYFEIKHPIGNLVKKYLLTKEYLVNGGVSSVLLLASSLLTGSLDLIHKGLDPSIIIQGFKKSLTIVNEYLDNEIKTVIVPELFVMNDCKSVLKYTFQSKSVFGQEQLLESLLDALNQLPNHFDINKRLDSIHFTLNYYFCGGVRDDISNDSNSLMNREKESKFQVQIEFNNSRQLMEWRRDEELVYRDWVEHIVKMGVNTLIVQLLLKLESITGAKIINDDDIIFSNNSSNQDTLIEYIGNNVNKPDIYSYEHINLYGFNITITTRKPGNTNNNGSGNSTTATPSPTTTSTAAVTSNNNYAIFEFSDPSTSIQQQQQLPMFYVVDADRPDMPTIVKIEGIKLLNAWNETLIYAKLRTNNTLHFTLAQASIQNSNANIRNGLIHIESFPELTTANAANSKSVGNRVNLVNCLFSNIFRGSALVVKGYARVSLIGTVFENNESSDHIVLQRYGRLIAKQTIWSKNYGGMYLWRVSSIKIQKCTFLKNHNQNGGGVFIEGSNNDNFYDDEDPMPSGSVTIEDTTFFSNLAYSNGGGLAVDSPLKLDIRLCRFMNNTSLNRGGAIYLKNVGNASISLSQLDVNQGVRGGAIFTKRSNVSIQYTSISNNNFGAIYCSQSNLTVDRSNKMHSNIDQHIGDALVGVYCDTPCRISGSIMDTWKKNLSKCLPLIDTEEESKLFKENSKMLGVLISMSFVIPVIIFIVLAILYKLFKPHFNYYKNSNTHHQNQSNYNHRNIRTSGNNNNNDQNNHHSSSIITTSFDTNNINNNNNDDDNTNIIDNNELDEIINNNSPINNSSPNNNNNNNNNDQNHSSVTIEETLEND
eukprot:gene10306-12647_t